MPTNITPTLDPAKAYIYCPLCSQAGTEKSPLTRDSHLLRCSFGHSFDGAQLRGMRARGIPVEMEKLSVIEQPPDYCRKFEVWANPQVWQALQQKFHGRFLATMITYLEALADDSILLIEGEEVEEMRKLGVKTGLEILAALRDRATLQNQLDEANEKIQKFMNIFAQAGVAG